MESRNPEFDKMLMDQVNEKAEKEKKLEELDGLFEKWLTPEKLEALHGITLKTEALASPERAEAKGGCAAMLKIIGGLKESLSKEDHDSLMDKYRTLSMAVGMLSAKSDQVDHTR